MSNRRVPVVAQPVGSIDSQLAAAAARRRRHQAVGSRLAVAAWDRRIDALLDARLEANKVAKLCKVSFSTPPKASP